MASAIRSRANSCAGKFWKSPLRSAAISSSLSPYILPPAEFASIQNGHPTRAAVRSKTRDRSLCGTFVFWPSSHSVNTVAQKTRGTRAAIFCGVRSRPSAFRTCLKTYRIRKLVRFGSTPCILVIVHSAKLSSLLDPQQNWMPRTNVQSQLRPWLATSLKSKSISSCWYGFVKIIGYARNMFLR